jgi:hypothetical protein
MSKPRAIEQRFATAYEKRQVAEDTASKVASTWQRTFS